MTTDHFWPAYLLDTKRLAFVTLILCWRRQASSSAAIRDALVIQMDPRSRLRPVFRDKS